MCVLSLRLGVCAGNESIIGIAFHSSITFLSGSIPRGPMCILSARRAFDWGVRSLSPVAEFWREVCDVSHSSGTAWLQMPLNGASKLASLNVSLHTFWHHSLNPLLLLLLLYLPSSSRSCFSTSLLPSRPSHLAVSSILLHTVSSDSACLPVRDTARLNFDLCIGGQCQRSMESMVTSRNMEAREERKTGCWRICITQEQQFLSLCV